MAIPAVFLLLLLTLISFSNAQNALVFPIRKDPQTSQFYTTLQMGSSRTTVNAVVDLGSGFLWFGCSNYSSRTYAPVPCDSPKCETAKGIGCFGCNRPRRPGCTNDTCGAGPYNPFQDVFVSAGFWEDTLWGTGSVRVQQFVFSCMHDDSLMGLARGTTGMLGLGRRAISLHRHVADSLGLPDRFSLCPPASGIGKLSVGIRQGGSSGIAMKSTGLINNPGPIFVPGDVSEQYFIGVTGIRVAGRALSVKDTYFTIDKDGIGGTKISTVQTYTAVHNSIYKTLSRAFDKAASDMKIKSAAAVGPFRACYWSDTISKTPGGQPDVPAIDLVLPGNVYWIISGGNAVVEVDRRTTCFAFVDGGSQPRTAVVIGVHQLTENYLEFDLVSSELRFSGSLVDQNKTCSSSKYF